MKRHTAFLLSLSAAGLAGLTGCGKEGTTGGPGATDPNAKPPLVGRQENTFAVSTSSLSVKPGGAATQSAVGIKRGSGFDQDVSVEFADLPKGVSVEPSKLTVPKGTSEAKFNAVAAFETAPGDYTVRVVGKPTSGADSVGEIKLTVTKPDTFAISVPFWTTGIKQGETKAFTLSAKRDSEFKEDVTLKFSGLPAGVTIDPASPVIKGGETEAKLLMKAADDAPVGDHVVKVTGHPAKGADATHDFKFTVSKK